MITISNKLKLIGVAVLFCGLFILFMLGSCQAKKIKAAQSQIAEMKQQIDDLKSKNEQLEMLIERYNYTILETTKALHAAQKEHDDVENQIKQIEKNDPDAGDWLSCPVPDSVRNVLKGFNAVCDDSTSGRVIDAM